MTPKKQLILPAALLFGAFSIIGFITELQAFTYTYTYSTCPSSRQKYSPRRHSSGCHPYTCSKVTSGVGVNGGYDKSEETVRVRDLLSDLPTPTLLIELSLAENALKNTNMSLDDALSILSSEHFPEILKPASSSSNNNNDEVEKTLCELLLDGSIFMHTQVTDTSIRDRINRDYGSGKSSVIGRVDACPKQHVSGGAYLGIGLSNHHVGGYYWARGMGIGASLEAHGVAFRGVQGSISEKRVEESDHNNSSSSNFSEEENSAISTTAGGELYWKRRSLDPAKGDSSGGGSGSDTASAALCRGNTTDKSSNSNDGKRSEWADFLVPGDTVQLIPYSAARVLRESTFQRLVGVRRVGRPLGADPIVERLWKREAPATEDESGRSNCISTTHHGPWVPL
uniref:Uncharacterized protein n=1 Tax=Pseudo-nitzschia australis TaxID=44445 RepID=A0A7S4AK37_9STRA|mmetsp:Transcript_2742/g.5908  ORF Transcript_2742/g.5908 Transcript_2742/m.5908 type:complete len:397 (-) Transcript_2742:1251-2441(-)|eukprot:CAMPEP_0168203596 /NCGR_PEP_ID=MMETSP0139_2-20121125/24940_1 /TAXON_ID=44445 /ORGANISM="Pseudo-nitzschia australis, Strain 10249 10 AB" /LENGTH=396 /DNA_ID=CAMNT_0008129461 /DNA_START=251 /DNA_END=1441 /DNA_ORIENTATION=+